MGFNRRPLGWPAACMLMLLTACATNGLNIPETTRAEIEAERLNQYDLLFDDRVHHKDYQKEMRVLNVAYPLLEAGASLCEGDTMHDYGFVVYDPTVYVVGNREASKRELILKKGLRPLYIVKGYPAARIGLSTEDTIIAVNDTTLTGMTLAEAEKTIKPMIKDGAPVTLTIERRGKQRTRRLESIELCDYPPKILRKAELNAYADGDNIYITSGMLNFTESDQELGVVLAHEIAHNVQEHISQRRGGAILGTIADILIAGTTGVSTGGLFGQVGALAYSQTYEKEADYLGLYLMARADMEIDGAERFWRRMAVATPESIGGHFASTHPSAPERFLILEKTIKEIRAKQQANQPLLPNES